jgi:hypothetical protein
MVFNATFNNISVISWQSVLLVEETGVPGENIDLYASVVYICYNYFVIVIFEELNIDLFNYGLRLLQVVLYSGKKILCILYSKEKNTVYKSCCDNYILTITILFLESHNTFINSCKWVTF